MEQPVPRGALDTYRRALFGTAMAVFVVTVSVGILNGLDLVEFERDTLLTHVHAGTLGWITLSVFALSFWMFEDEAQGGQVVPALLRSLTWVAIVSVPVYVVAFWSGEIGARALTSVPVFLAIVGFFAWLVSRARSISLTVPRLAMLAAFATLTIGGFFGTLVQIQLATSASFVPLGGAISGHVAAMAFGYLVLIGMAVAEWRLVSDSTSVSRAGATQVAALFIGGLLLTIGAVGNVAALLQLNVAFQLVAVAIFAFRLAPALRRVDWLARTPERLFAAAAVFVVVDIGLLVFLIVQLVSGAYGPLGEDVSLLAIPPWLIFALDHAIFIGVMSNAIFGLLHVLSSSQAGRMRWADDVVFWGMNVGVVGFVAGLALGEVLLKRVFSPMLGVSILVGLSVMAVRLIRR